MEIIARLRQQELLREAEHVQPLRVSGGQARPVGNPRQPLARLLRRKP